MDPSGLEDQVFNPKVAVQKEVDHVEKTPSNLETVNFSKHQMPSTSSSLEDVGNNILSQNQDQAQLPVNEKAHGTLIRRVRYPISPYHQLGARIHKKYKK
ncbi:unnamed protein product [Lepeophtheirus salmonis]|uniref:(salmon louse) hypothetical protein n=1 Tax=Lepeophtheirus salmonis TaxID=72036 RepID=A0A7R8CST6_LEPSM|nr:unnamed protein product [Lepeophtheirus salmonis]CAF2917176.1 unnamed protein product [Lepeophtheirus salmonis]